MTLVEKAREFAKARHEGQFRRDGVTPYFDHCEKVASLVDTEFEKAVAYCHDLLEDRRCTAKELQAVNDDVYNCVNALTKKENQPYEDYISSVRIYNLVIKVKIADIVANLSDKPTKEQIEKYNKTLRILAGV